MSIEDRILDVATALNGLPESNTFDKLQDFIVGSATLSMVADELIKYASIIKESHCYRGAWCGADNKLEHDRLIELANILKGNASCVRK